MADANKSTKVVVIGGGPGGYAAAFKCADLDMETVLIDPEENPGGVCLYRGCIPSKALLHVAKLIDESAEAKDWGVKFKKPEVDVDKLREWKADVVKKLTGGLGQLARARKVKHVRGMAKFLDAHTLEVSPADGDKYQLTFEYAILASGSRPATIPGIDIKSDRLLDSTSALEIKDVPSSLLVVGGGYIGLELGSVYASLGSKVTVVEMTSGLLPGADRDLVAVLQKRLKDKFEAIMLNTKVTDMKEQKNGIKVTLEGKDVDKPERIFDKVLVSIGRKPNSENLGLSKTGVQINDRGFVRVDLQRRTAEPSIYAIGDVAGEPMLAHKATHEGIHAAEAIAGHKVTFEPMAIPAVVFTDPEVAWAGITETQAKEQGLNVKVTKYPWAASGRALTLSRTDGVTKFIVDKDTERILGVAIVGVGAGELIAEGTLAIEMGAVAQDVALTIHPHPTTSETIMGAAELIYGPATDYYRKG